jgi:YegS/Rv2252/BmrU family lipid kinase
MTTVALIVNPHAGNAKPRLPAIEATLRELGVDFRAAETTSLAHARELATEAVRAGETVLSLGGDGLVGALAGAVSDAGGLLGVLPGGRGNDFGRVLGVPEDGAGAVRAVLGGEEQALDLGDVDGKPFVCLASAGFDSVANRIANETTWLKGAPVYTYAGLRAVIIWKPARFTLEMDTETISYSGYSFAAGNSKAYGGGMFMAPDAELDDGLLDVVCTGNTTKRRFVSYMPLLFEGKHVELPAVKVFRTRSMRVSADRPFTIYADGDPIAELPATISVRPGALRTLVPRAT